ncbi:MAG: alpha/beta fold hydrolase [Actinobacteria bacterium]|nr:alpha/beta fold hydrolase [Actinomycetota bacterium]
MASAACGADVPLIALPAGDATTGRVTYPTRDRVQIVAEFTPPPGPALPYPVVILAHQFGGTRAQWAGLAPALHKAGFGTLIPDLRAHGESVRRLGAGASEELYTDARGALPDLHLDIEAALRWLTAQRNVDPARLGIGGASVGANLAFVAAGAFAAIGRAVAVGPAFSTSGVLVGANIPDFRPRGIRFLTDRREEPEVRALYGKTEEPRDLKVYDMPGHGLALLAHEQPQRDFVEWFVGGL